MAEIILLNPRFSPSYWGWEHALPMLRAAAVLPPASLPLLAALTPAEHNVTIIDENIEEIDFDRCAHADIVGLTGMNVQRRRMHEILRELKIRGAFVVVGGPWVTVYEQDFEDLPDAVFIGEAEKTWPQFLNEWTEGRQKRRYEQENKTDMATVPMLDLSCYRCKNTSTAAYRYLADAHSSVNSATLSSSLGADRGSRPPGRSLPNLSN
jgi:radical SAM superfamily enzyme YgiQ (UPF0313 family)